MRCRILSGAPCCGNGANSEWVSLANGRPGGYTAIGYTDGMGSTLLAWCEGNVARHWTVVWNETSEGTAEKGLTVADGTSSMAAEAMERDPLALTTLYISV